MAYSFYVLQPGLAPPHLFKPSPAPLLSLSELWSSNRMAPPSLLFRVRSDKEGGEGLDGDDQFESCVGLLDSAVRWRACFRVGGAYLSAMRSPALLEACQKAFAFIGGTHPAAVTQASRMAAIEQIQQAIESTAGFGGGRPEAKAQLAYDHLIATFIGRLVASDNDIELSGQIPMIELASADLPAHDRAAFNNRMVSVETTISAALLTEAAGRLCERLPVWLYSEMPVFDRTSTRTERAERPARPAGALRRSTMPETDDEQEPEEE